MNGGTVLGQILGLNSTNSLFIGTEANGQLFFTTNATTRGGFFANGRFFVDSSGATVDNGAAMQVTGRGTVSSDLLVGQLTLNTTPSGTAVVGTTRWNDTIGSTETTLKGGSVILKNGVDLVARVVNKVSPNTTLTKAAYQAVRVSGAQGQRLAVALAQANNDNNSADTIGLVTETIATNQEGFIITVGQLENINTTGSLQGETWVDGDVIYLSPTTAGALTNVKPTAPQHIIVIGYVEYAHANNGKIYVKVMNGWELGELHDVDTTGATNGQVLKYNGTIWTPSSDAGITGSGLAGQVSYWSGTSTQAGSNNLFWDATNSRLGIGTNAPLYLLDTTTGQTVARFQGGVFFTNNSISNLNRISSSSSTSFFWQGDGTGSAYNQNVLNFQPSTGSLGFHFTNNSGASILRIFSATQNVSIGSNTDSGQRLQVTGEAIITSATTPQLRIDYPSGGSLRISATSVANSFTLLDPQGYGFQHTTTFSGINARQTNARIWTQAVDTLIFSLGGQDTNPTVARTRTHIEPVANATTAFAPTSGTAIDYNFRTTGNSNFAPTSGTATYTQVQLQPTINQTGGANGITRGLYVNPTLTAAADWRSIEWSNNSGWGLYGAGTATNYLAGSLGIGGTSLAQINLRVSKNISGSTESYSVWQNGIVQSGVTALAVGYINLATTQATAFTLTTYRHFASVQSTIGASSTITNQQGFYVDSTLTGATNNFGFFGDIPSGTGRWNLYMNGTANNYIAGNLGIGITSPPQPLSVQGTILTRNRLQISNGRLYEFIGTSTNLDITDTSSVITMMRFFANGNVAINSTTDSGEKLQVTGTAKITSKLSMGAGTTSNAQINLASSTAPTTPANGDIWFDGTDLKMRIGGVTKTFTLI
jgi:nitrogen fixation protein